jgi:hypothetical protein
MARDPNRFWNPYLAGVALGLVLLAAFVLTGKGLGASGAWLRAGVTVVQVAAPAHVEGVPLLAGATEDGPPLRNWLVFEVLGVMVGGFLGAWTSGRFGVETLKGPRVSTGARQALAVLGGVAMGIGAGMARGCASGQGLSGGALLSAGGWAFMMSFFAGGYAVAWFVRREWR